MAEAAVSNTIMRHLKAIGHAVRVENLVGSGMPDVSYCVGIGHEGFIENKWRSTWPRKDDDAVTLKHFTAHQRLWITDRTRAGGRVFVLLGVGNPRIEDWLLFEGGYAAMRLGLASKWELVREARAVSLGAGFPWENIRKLL